MKAYLLTLFTFSLSITAIAQQDGVIDDLGDIAFIASEASDFMSLNQGFSFLALDEIPNGTQIIFIDEEWDGTAFGNGEGEVTWTNNMGMTLPRGTVVDIVSPNDNPVASIGMAVESDAGFNYSGPEQIFTIVGSRMSPTFLAYLDNNGGDNTNTLAGTGIVPGTTGLSASSDPFIYDGPLTCNTTQNDCLMQIANPANYSNLLSFPDDVPNMLAGDVLPVELTYFTATSEREGVWVKWGTATETNNAYMVVERSFDGVKFQEIGRVKGAGTTLEPQSYSFLDENPLAGVNYYRLRQVDVDGTTNWHPVVAVDVKTGTTIFSIQPNVVTDFVQVSLQTERTNSTLLQIFDAQGRLVKEWPMPVHVYRQDINISDLPGGLYLARVQLDGVVLTKKLVKQ